LTTKGNRKQYTDLVGQHDAIRAQMKFLTESLNGFDLKPDSVETDPSRIVKTIREYSYTLRDLRAGVITHIELDERIFNLLSDSTAENLLTAEHKKIFKQIDQAINLVDEAYTKGLDTPKLKQKASEIIVVIDKIRKLIQSHTVKEDKLLELL
jgi:3-deoxy-D-arabino-heptulosonate 7-phosphate (DAHP) synthase class II